MKSAEELCKIAKNIEPLVEHVIDILECMASRGATEVIFSEHRYRQAYHALFEHPQKHLVIKKLEELGYKVTIKKEEDSAVKTIPKTKRVKFLWWEYDAFDGYDYINVSVNPKISIKIEFCCEGV